MMLVDLVCFDQIFSGSVSQAEFLFVCIRFLLLVFLVSTSTLWVFGKLSGQSVTLLRSLIRALRLTGSIVAAAVLSVVAMLVGGLVFGLPGIVLLALAPPADATVAAAAASGIGRVLLGLGALTNLAVVGTVVWMVLPVAVVERPGIVGSLRRSRQLVAGNRSTVFGLLIVLVLMEFALVWSGVLFPGMVFGFELSDTIGFSIFLLVLTIAFSAFVSVITGVAYVLLRAEEAARGRTSGHSPGEAGSRNDREP